MRTKTICFATCLTICFVTSGRAQELTACQSIGDDKARLACYDAVAKAETIAPPRNSIVRSKAVVTPSAPATFRQADLGMIMRSPDSFTNKPLLFKRMRCTFVDVNDYRCSPEAGEPLEIRAPIIVPPPMQTAVEGRCGSLYKERKPACGGTLRVIATTVRTDPKGGIQIEASTIALDMGGR